MKAVSKVKTKEQITPSFDFPILMKNVDEDFVVMFGSATEGVVVVSSSNDFRLGEYSENWSKCTHPEIWTPFTGEITLKNE